AGEFYSPLPDQGIQSFVESICKFIHIGGFNGLFQLILSCIGSWEHNIFPYASLEQKLVLQHHAKVFTITFQVYLGQILTIYGYSSRYGVEETGRQSGNGGFSRTRAAYKRYYLARSYLKINIVEYFFILLVGKGNIPKGDRKSTRLNSSH